MSEQKTTVKSHRKIRRPMPMSAKIRRALAQGRSVHEIAKTYRVDTNYVRQVRWKENQKKAAEASPSNLPPAGATIDFQFDASSQSLTPVMVQPAPAQPSPPTQEPGGIVLLIDKKEAAPNPVAVEERKPSLWERFKLWAFGVR